MRILVVGDGHSSIHEVAVVKAFIQLGYNVNSFYWQSYFISRSPLSSFLLKVQNKFLIGPAIKRLNNDLEDLALKTKPDLIFVYRGTHIKRRTVQKIKNVGNGCVVAGYNNDDPFSAAHFRLLWRHFLRSTPYYDLMFAYRHHNLTDFIGIGAKRVELLRSWYLPWSNYQIELSECDRSAYACDVVFIGHFEDDGRLRKLEEIARAGYSLRLFGPPDEWDQPLRNSRYLRHLAPVRAVWGDEYNKALCGSKVALCFFSKLNRDTYTRRCFEIPATGTLLLSEYSEDLATIYNEGQEAEFFRGTEELISKVSHYVGNEKLRRQVALSGKERLQRDGHDIISRMEKVLEHVRLLQSKG